ncbi:MAG TPA: helix-turn-helix domain-containing protein [Candidatus Angelobacter sp.]|nr:helix-turn-helix domain-containing protein [Candidatus Angelobacter sp.]
MNQLRAPQATATTVNPADLPHSFNHQMTAIVQQLWATRVSYGESVREFKKRFIRHVLRENHGNACRAARELGIHRNTLSRICQELRLDPRDFRPGYYRRPVKSVPAREALRRIEQGA